MYKAHHNLSLSYAMLSFRLFLKILFIPIISLSSVYWSLSVESFLQRLTQAGMSRTLENTQEQEWAKDIFLTTLKNYNASQAWSILESIHTISSKLKQQAEQINARCPISDSDVFTVLAWTPDFLTKFYTISDVSLSQSSDLQWNITDSCNTILSCAWQLKKGQGISDTTRQISQCQEIIQQAYTINQQLNANYKDIPLINNNDNIYTDNIKDNGLFDLMVDIENIKKVLFDPWIIWPEAPQMIYYSMPSIQRPALTQSWKWSTQWSTAAWSTTTNENSWTMTQTWPTPIQQPISWPTSTQISQPPLSSEIDSFIFHTNPPEWIPFEGPSGISTTKIVQTLCLLDPSASTIWPINLPSSGNDPRNPSTSEDQIEELTRIQETISATIDWFLFTPWDNAPASKDWSSFNIWQNFIQFSWAPLQTTTSCSSSCSQQEGLEKSICEGKCCINSCNQIKNVKDKAICLSQCICGEASVANDLLRIKICRVPVQSARAVAGKKINSVEEAITEISQIFNTLKQSWALIKRTKKKWFLDSSFSSTKFKNILSFDIFVMTKPIFDVPQQEEIQQEVTNNYKTLWGLNGTSWQRGEGRDKNKYNVNWLYWSEIENKKECELNGWIYNETTKKCDRAITNLDIVSALAQAKFINTTNDNLWEFFSQHYRFWNEIYGQISDFNGISQNLRAKADQAK